MGVQWKSPADAELATDVQRDAAYKMLIRVFTSADAAQPDAVADLADNVHKAGGTFQTPEEIARASVRGFRRVELAFQNAV